MQVWSLLPDAVVDVFNRSLASRIAVGIVELPFSFWLATSLFVPFHEFGHARAVAALGWNYEFGDPLAGSKAGGVR
jgi:hypothetical protein